MEQWKTVAEWPAYEVSNLGRVRRQNRILVASWTGTVGKQYLACGLCDGARRRCARVHILVAESFLGPKPMGLETAHLDGDRANNALNNLRYVTCSENNLHKREHGTMSRGEDRHNAKLTPEDVLDIRRRAAPRSRVNGYAALAREYGISEQHAFKVANRKAWVHVA